jgi:hypothetical protein
MAINTIDKIEISIIVNYLLLTYTFTLVFACPVIRTARHILWQGILATGRLATYCGKESWRLDGSPHIVARNPGDWTARHILWQGILATGRLATYCGKKSWRLDGFAAHLPKLGQNFVLRNAPVFFVQKWELADKSVRSR